MKGISVHKNIKQAWGKWLSLTRERVHPYYALEGGNLKNHLDICFNGALETTRQIINDIGGYEPSSILEIGCSIGFKCLAFDELFAERIIFGIEPDMDAIQVGMAMAEGLGAKKISFIRGKGEYLPFANEMFDLIVCHTTIEHVESVDNCLGEMARVLKPGGFLHIEAPNYLWPVEPHLGIIVPPLCPKLIMRFLAKLQGAAKEASYVNHLNLVHPTMIERLFKENGLKYENKMHGKFIAILKGEMESVKSYKRLAHGLRIIQKIGCGEIIARTLMASRFYPSLLYIARKPS
jgi:ubiquinone/menaquinone biosynthesis C-methylase UbiE